MGDDAVFRWIVSGGVLGLPGLLHLARAFSRGAHVERRAGFERRYGCRVPDRLWPRVQRRLSGPDRYQGIVLLALVPVAATLPLPGAHGDDLVASFLPLAAIVVDMTVVPALYALKARGPLVGESGVGLPSRTVILADYVPRRMRVVTVAAEAVVGGLLVTAVVALAQGSRGGAVIVAAAMAGAAALTSAALEVSARRLATTVDASLDRSELFLEDALRTAEQTDGHQVVVAAAGLAVTLPVIFTAVFDPGRADVALAFVVFFLVAPALAWAARADRGRFVARLWGGEVPQALLPAPVEAPPIV